MAFCFQSRRQHVSLKETWKVFGPKSGPDSVSKVKSISLSLWMPQDKHRDQHPTASLSAYSLQTFQNTLDISGLFTYIYITHTDTILLYIVNFS